MFTAIVEGQSCQNCQLEKQDFQNGLALTLHILHELHIEH